MIRRILRRPLDSFERAFDYDMSYAREILDASIRALMAFSKVMAFAQYREGAPADAWYTAKLVATLGEDCGPCTQLMVDMATREHVDPAQIRSVLDGRLEAMSADVALAYRFTQASLSHDLAANELRDEIVNRWGKRGLVSVAFAIASARVFPTLKYALGHGHACTRVSVAGVDQAPRRSR